ncbi:hypothetical protein SAMN04489762_3441 [Terribacillus saccharophilus]|uniref:DUF3847 domain-containing protein n=1 Tax=Terribacillus saccharophilus TaxID=361277 RepID=A0AAX2EJS5_9BACI|nr:hypothetical protein SAMN04489762_3441 [Terribacillus saccharophilus]
MVQNTKSKILSIDEQIQKLKEKRNREVAKLERSAGKKFIESFNLEDKSSEEIQVFIEGLKEKFVPVESEMSTGEFTNEQSDKQA